MGKPTYDELVALIRSFTDETMHDGEILMRAKQLLYRIAKAENR